MRRPPLPPPLSPLLTRSHLTLHTAPPSPADAANQLVDRYGPNCTERCAARDFLFEVLRRLVLPPHLKFLMWLTHAGVAEEGAAEGEGKSASPVWHRLAGELNISSEAAEKLRGKLRALLFFRDLPMETWRLGAAAAYVKRLKSVVNLTAARAQAQLQAVRDILTPAQLVRYLAWAHSSPSLADTTIPF